jgi:hypothetical protein
MTQREVSLSNRRDQCQFESDGKRCPDEVMPRGPEVVFIFCAKHQDRPRYIAVPVRTSEAEGIRAESHAAYLRSLGHQCSEWQNEAVIIGPSTAPSLQFLLG